MPYRSIYALSYFTYFSLLFQYDRIDATDARKHAAAIEEGAFSHSKKDSSPSDAIRSYGDKAVELMYAILKGSEAKDPHTNVDGTNEVTPKSIPALAKEGGLVVRSSTKLQVAETWQTSIRSCTLQPIV